MSDLRLLQDGSNCGGALVSKAVASETASEGKNRNVSVGVSMGADTKANTRGRGALELGDLRLLEDGSERSGAIVSKAVVLETASEGQNGNGECRCVNGH